MIEQTNKRRILHVDDEKDVLHVVKLILEKEGLDVVSTTVGKRALRLALLNDYDLVILDVMMPGMCGWNVFTKLSKHKPLQKIMYMTALQADNELLHKLKHDGVVDYILKPFDRIDLITRVKQIIDKQEAPLC